MKHEILSISAAIALFVVLVWLYTMPFRKSGALKESSESQAAVVQTSTAPPELRDDKKALERGFHALFDALLGR